MSSLVAHDVNSGVDGTRQVLYSYNSPLQLSQVRLISGWGVICGLVFEMADMPDLTILRYTYIYTFLFAETDAKNRR